MRHARRRNQEGERGGRGAKGRWGGRGGGEGWREGGAGDEGGLSLCTSRKMSKRAAKMLPISDLQRQRGGP